MQTSNAKAMPLPKFPLLANNDNPLAIVSNGKANKDVTSFLMCLGATAIGFIIADIFGSVSIPLLFKFGAEKARMMTLIAFVVPVIVCYGAYQLLMALL